MLKDKEKRRIEADEAVKNIFNALKEAKEKVKLVVKSSDKLDALLFYPVTGDSEKELRRAYAKNLRVFMPRYFQGYGRLSLLEEHEDFNRFAEDLLIQDYRTKGIIYDTPEKFKKRIEEIAKDYYMNY